MGIQYKNMKNNIKPKNYPKSKTVRMSINLALTDWLLFIKPSVPCSVRINTSEKMSVDSIQALPSRASTQMESS